MKITVRKMLIKLLVLLVTVSLTAAGCLFKPLEAEESFAAEGFSIKVGFYGGPYYEVKSYSAGQLSALSDHKVYLYTGVDAGGFMTASYAWGVRIEDLMADARIDGDSIKFLYFKTSDSRDESIVTYRASALMGSRLAYPNMIKAVDLESGQRQQTLNNSKLTEEITGGSKSVPTILALGYTSWSREEIVRAAQPTSWKEETVIEEYEEMEEYQVTEEYEETEEYIDENGDTQTRTVTKERVVTKTRPVTKTREVTRKVPAGRTGFKSYSAEDLGCPSGYRLTYGQGSILENNVRSSSKNISGIYVQLSGAPNISISKKLISGKDGEVGSRYSIQLKVSLPDCYDYIPEDIRQELQKQMLDNISLESGDGNALKLTPVKGKSGQYTAEIIGEGNTEVNYSYTRQDYDGTTEASGTIGLADMEEGQGDQDGPSSNGNESSDSQDDKSGTGLKDDSSDSKEEEADQSEGDSQVKWMAADEIVESGSSPLITEVQGNMKSLAAGAGGLFAAGIASALAIYIRRR